MCCHASGIYPVPSRPSCPFANLPASDQPPDAPNMLSYLDWLIAASEVSRLVDDGGLVSITVLGRTSTDPKCHLIAVKALENVSKTPEFVRFMIQEGTLEIVTMVLGHKTLSNALVALRTLLNMAKPELTRSKICSVDLLKSLERFVNHDELSVQREGFRLLTMFTEDHRTHKTLVELGTIRLLISVVASPMKPRDIKLDCIHCIAELAHSPVAQLQMNKMKVAGLGGQILKPFVVLIDLIETVDGPKLSCEAMRALGGIAETGTYAAACMHASHQRAHFRAGFAEPQTKCHTLLRDPFHPLRPLASGLP